MCFNHMINEGLVASPLMHNLHHTSQDLIRTNLVMPEIYPRQLDT